MSSTRASCTSDACPCWLFTLSCNSQCTSVTHLCSTRTQHAMHDASSVSSAASGMSSRRDACFIQPSVLNGQDSLYRDSASASTDQPRNPPVSRTRPKREQPAPRNRATTYKRSAWDSVCARDNDACAASTIAPRPYPRAACVRYETLTILPPHASGRTDLRLATTAAQQSVLGVTCNYR